MHKIISVTPVMANAGGYSAGDQVGVPIVITDAVRNHGGQALLKSLSVIDQGNGTGVALDVWFFNSLPTTVADNAAFDMTDTNLKLALGHVKVVAGDYSAQTSGSLASVRNIDLLLEAIAGSRDLYVVCVTRGTPTYTSLDLVLKIGVEQL